jgi:cytidylate kinase
LRVAISGKSGCGNTTVSTLVAQKLNYPLINYTFRAMAIEKGVDFWELHRQAEIDDNVDLELDRRQVKKALEQTNCVLGSRLAIWMLQEADVKIYLTASDEVRARRIFEREGGSYADRLAQTKERDANDSARYKRLYNIDNNDPSIADIVIDTELFTAEEIAHQIVSEVEKRL